MTDSFFIEFNIPKENINLNHQSSVITLGSCFSDEIGEKLSFAGFDVLVNPLGSLFHPMSIVHALSFALGQREKHLVKKSDVFLDYAFSGKLYAMSEQELSLKLGDIGDQLARKLSTSTHLILTFGTSIGYELTSSFLVANCHQQPASNFHKVNSSIDAMYEALSTILDKLYQINSDLKVLVTVSPVRHLKDGIIENGRSKAKLLSLCEMLEGRGVNYFPAYEIFMDELRDYRFSKEDLTHPNEIAVDYIWKKFKSAYLDESTLKLTSEVEAYHRSLNHRILYPESQGANVYKEKLIQTHENLINRMPNLRLKSLPL
jgi:hypothetical protein